MNKGIGADGRDSLSLPAWCTQHTWSCCYHPCISNVPLPITRAWNSRHHVQEEHLLWPQPLASSTWWVTPLPPTALLCLRTAAPPCLLGGGHLHSLSLVNSVLIDLGTASPQHHLHNLSNDTLNLRDLSLLCIHPASPVINSPFSWRATSFQLPP